MTKRREPLTSHKALLTIAGMIGIDECARIARREERTIRDWSDPDTSAGVTLDAAREMDAAYLRAGGDHAPFASWYHAQIHLIHAEIDAGAIDRLKAAAVVAKEAGDATAAQIIACRPGATRADLAIAERETRELISVAAASLAGFDPDHLSDVTETIDAN